MINIDNIEQTRDKLKKEVLRRQEYMRSILDFATGYKKLPNQNHSLLKYRNSDQRFISTIKMLHCQLREFQKDIKLLDKLLAHQKLKPSKIKKSEIICDE
jgi:hypothetical protein